MVKVFINGGVGTTGLRIVERLSVRDDVELISIPDECRKDPVEVKKRIEMSDVTFLCLPDAAAIEAVALAEGSGAKIIDTSTAHRTNEAFAYGFAELSNEHREKIKNGNRIAVPGCHASGFVALMYPMVKNGFVSADASINCFSLTGYSGGGKSMIADYQNDEREEELSSPRIYALSQNHKHLREMAYVTGLENPPVFSPIVADYYSGMVVSIPLTKDMCKATPKEISEMFKSHYEGQHLINVKDYDPEQTGMIGSNNLSMRDSMEIMVCGNDDRFTLHARFDNLGKGASGAAIQCFNIMTGQDETKGLVL